MLRKFGGGYKQVLDIWFLWGFCLTSWRNKKRRTMKYPIGIQTFENLREGGFVYVDKTALVHKLVDSGTIYFLCRPRRFGKSLLLSTIKAYFQGKKELFKGLAMEKLETRWDEYPVFHVDFNGVDFGKEGAVESVLSGYVDIWADKYNVKNTANLPIGKRFERALVAAHEATGRRCVVLIDEYDKPLLDVLDTEMEGKNRETLKAFYSTFKAADEHLRFVMLTGVTKFSQITVFSGLNQPRDISMSPQYDTICGISEEELHKYFDDEIAAFAREEGIPVEKLLSEMRKKYDGYYFSRNMIGVYNPFSFLNALQDRQLDDYWFRTGTPTYLIRLMEHFEENINEMIAKPYPPSEFIDYRADVEKPLPMIYQSGYLTIKGYDKEMNEYWLDFPNNEVKRGFVSMIASSYLKTSESVTPWISSTVRALKRSDLEQLRKLLTSFLASIPYTVRRKEDERERERYFHYTFYLILRMISTYLVFTEKETSHGRADCVIETPSYIYIFEFKLDSTAAEAIAQINESGYAREYEADARPLYKIGCGFSSATGTISDWAVERC